MYPVADTRGLLLSRRIWSGRGGTPGALAWWVAPVPRCAHPLEVDPTEGVLRLGLWSPTWSGRCLTRPGRAPYVAGRMYQSRPSRDPKDRGSGRIQPRGYPAVLDR